MIEPAPPQASFLPLLAEKEDESSIRQRAFGLDRAAGIDGDDAARGGETPGWAKLRTPNIIQTMKNRWRNRCP